ncbi:CDGSH iron-sulfur domain-containing protein [Nocardia lijiangensis]|uniref:CDGSH iron-sulfur domain-containing protein n=1 Tax=Nocardia lijiangensis TaxID=299618 RepID=UPI000B0F44C3|nr:CDGSH iron-sulfur domain-containing protein [Nocardia lijiangensis]
MRTAIVAICLCRRSKNYPLCDTSHRNHRRARRVGRRRFRIDSAAGELDAGHFIAQGGKAEAQEFMRGSRALWRAMVRCG